MAGFSAAQDATVAPLMRLLQSGRLPKERQPQVLEMICQRGGPAELRFVFDQLLKPDAFDPLLRRKILDWLADAAQTRKVKPDGDLSGIGQLLKADRGAKNQDLPLRAVRLASLWKVESLAGDLTAMAKGEKSNLRLRQAAIRGLAEIGTPPAQESLAELAGSNRPTAVRALAAAGLARHDIDAATARAVEIITSATAKDELGPLLDAFFLRQDGPDKLAAALANEKLDADVAKRALVYMLSVGRSDQALSDVLTTAAGIAADAPPPSQEQVQKIVAEVTAKGDAARGEVIFRRTDLSCMKCHAVSRAGGQIGPELSAVGSISPVDYIVNAILNPDLAKKEQYLTKMFQTIDGEVLTGIVVDRNDERVDLRDAAGRIITLATEDILGEKEGKSLMPQGITKFLTHEELLDLAKFVSELGKPGPYAIPKVPAIQRWRVLREPPADLLADPTNVELLRLHVLAAPADAWTSAYGMVNGTLPLAELRTADGPNVFYLQGELNVTTGGEIVIRVQSTESALTWIDAEPFESSAEIKTSLTAGRHSITVRIELSDRSEPTLRVEIARPEGSTAQLDVVGGQ
ncbi:MAG TPA: HEAT repeat domain-containing protein [Pirellulaceae bacterium]|nr:HEAT repeat domain-containing protein [Pirellulaceae bacterium]